MSAERFSSLELIPQLIISALRCMLTEILRNFHGKLTEISRKVTFLTLINSVACLFLLSLHNPHAVLSSARAYYPKCIEVALDGLSGNAKLFGHFV